MPVDYEKIRDYNRDRYGWDIDRVAKMAFADSYADRTHFIFELLQNAEDAIRRRGEGWGGDRTVSFLLSQDQLRVSHCGAPFNEDDVRGICGIGESTKSDDYTSIGRFGIGFKSVYRFTSRPEVHSDDESFAIESFVWPESVPPIRRGEDETLFSIPIDSQNPIDDYDDIADGLAGLDVDSFLFLRHIDSLSWEVDGCDSGHYLRKVTEMDDLARQVNVIGQVTDLAGVLQEISEEWWVFSREVEHGGESAGQVEIAFRIDPATRRIQRIAESKLVVYFPTVKETHLGFLVQGPYRTTPNRDNVPETDGWNQYLVEETAKLLVDTLVWLRDRDMVDAELLSCLPINRIPDGMFDPLFGATKKALVHQPILPKFGGGYLAANRAALGDSEGMRGLLSESQLSEIYEKDTSWLSGDFTVDRNLELRRYLMSELGVNEVTPTSMVGRLSQEYLENQSDAWITRIYEFLGTRGDQRLRRLCSVKPLIRLKEGMHVAATTDGRPNAYLPLTNDTDFPTVRKSVCDTPDALGFLKSLGLMQPDPIDNVIENILTKYSDPGMTFEKEEYEYDVNLVLAAYHGSDSYSQTERMRRVLAETPWVMSVDAGHGLRFRSKPAEVLLPNDRLRSLFSGVSGILFVDDQFECLRISEARDLLIKCGVVSNFRPTRFHNEARFSNDERCQMRQDAYGEQRYSTEETPQDWRLEGLADVLAMLPHMQSEEHAQNSLTIWNLMRESDRTIFEGEYSWFYRTIKSCKFDSSIVELLNETQWVATNGIIARPGEVEFDELGWQVDEFLLSKIKFKSTEIENVAKKLGARASFLEKIFGRIESGELTEDEWDRLYPQNSEAGEVEGNGTTDGVPHNDADEPVAFEKSLRSAMTSTPTESVSRPVIMPSGGPKTVDSAAQDTRRAVGEGRSGRRVSREVTRIEPSAEARKLGARFKQMLLGDYDKRCQICGSTFLTRSGDLQTFADHVVDPSEGEGTNHLGNLMSLCGWHFALISYGQWVLLDPLTDEPLEEISDRNQVMGILELLLKAEREIDNDGNEFITIPVRFWNIYSDWSADAEHVDEEIRFTIPHREYLRELLKA